MIDDSVPRPEIPLRLANARRIALELETMYIGLNRPAEELGIDTYSTIIMSDEDPEVTFTKSNGTDKGTFIANCLNLIIPDASPAGTCTLFFTTFGDSEFWGNVRPEEGDRIRHAGDVLPLPEYAERHALRLSGHCLGQYYLQTLQHGEGAGIQESQDHRRRS